ncbi:MAG: hypothetical protein JWP44_3772 [Mucilaginibacter sp.]|nr:hypothetical protein [Mucilaginibacter sp.]
MSDIEIQPSSQGSDSENEKKYRFYYQLSAAMVLFSKCFLILCVFGLLMVTSYFYSNEFISSARWFIVGIEFAVMCALIFTIVHNKIFLPPYPYNKPLLSPDPAVLDLVQKVNKDAQRYGNAAYGNYRMVFYYKICTIILAGLSTVVLGLHFEAKSGWFVTGYPIFSKNVALVIGTIITIYTSIMTFFNVEKYWLINKTLSNKLRSLLDDVENADKLKELNTPQQVQAFVDQYKTIKGDFYKYWEGALSDRGSQGS